MISKKKELINGIGGKDGSYLAEFSTRQSIPCLRSVSMSRAGPSQLLRAKCGGFLLSHVVDYVLRVSIAAAVLHSHLARKG